ncbi:polysaccharide pyruvyl transferase family protein, partial [Akkermansiaceae bacterium]|nr:polysaccharide pyruvyl transferase family protein [Akkermansiaceae bacterium]
ILTFHSGPNYGGFLQAWHMREAVRNFGYEAEIINYQNSMHASSENPTLPSLSLRDVKGFAWNWLKRRPFKPWIAELCSTPLIQDPELVDWESYHLVIVGSDVVWDFSNQRYGADRVYFGAHESQKNTDFIAYAPSFGEAMPGQERPDFIDSGLQRFSAIRVRDDNSATIVEEALGDRPEVICDPTWLNDTEPALLEPPKFKERYIVVYGPELGDQRLNVLRDYARTRGLKIVSAGTPCKLADKVYHSLTPTQWLALIKNAEGVVTSTLHGSHYAMKFSRPMVFLEGPNSRLKARKAIEMAGRIGCWLPMGEELDLQHLTKWLDPDQVVPPMPIDWICRSREIFRKDLSDIVGPATSLSTKALDSLDENCI